MPVRARGRRSGVPLRAQSERLKTRGKISIKQEKFIRKLIHLLTHVVNEDGTFGVDDDKFDEIADTSAPTSHVHGDNEEKETIKKATDRDLSQFPHGQKPNEINRVDVPDEGKNLIRFFELCKRHNELVSQKTNQMRNSLNALGGGHASEALKTMDEKIRKIRGIVSERIWGFTPRTDDFEEGSNEFSYAATKLAKEFRKLRFFDASLFDSLETLKVQMKISATKIRVEYGFYSSVDEYLDFIMEALASSFEIYIRELEIAEKASASHAQEFSSQRYLNLTTIATFLSSVTATTLQTTATDDASTLRTTTNTLWFISLVFSTASAVYSLLIMTWRQSSVHQKDLSLPALADAWLRNGPMYSLIAALSTFSIGLCLFAFLVVEQQGGLASAAVPIGFAGFHAYTILLLSGWIIFAQSRDRMKQYWDDVRRLYLIPFVEFNIRAAKKTVKCIRASAFKMGRGFKMFSSLIVTTKLGLGRSPGLDQSSLGRIELGQHSTSAPTEETRQQHSEEETKPVDDTESPKPEHEQLNLERVTIPGNEPRGSTAASGAKHKPSVELLQFSPNGGYLASAISDTVTIYNVYRNFNMIGTYKVPGADAVEQISMNSFYNDLLVRSSKQICIWNSVDEERHAEPSAKLDVVVTSSRWENNLYTNDRAFVCAVGRSVKKFSNSCEELRSCDVSHLREIECILDVAFFRKKYIFGLVTTPEKATQLLVFTEDFGSIKCDVSLKFGHTSIVTHGLSNKVLLYGSQGGVEVVEFSSADEEGLSVLKIYRLRESINEGHGLNPPEAIVALYCDTIISYSAGEVIPLYHKPDDKLLSALHIFTTANVEATVEDAMIFAVTSFWHPYMFAFRDKHGYIKIWSVQSYRQLGRLARSKGVKDFVVRDQRDGRDGPTILTKGRYLILPPSEVNEPAGV